MKILFINKYDITGGAGIAAYRLHQGLTRYHKTTDAFVVGIKRSDDPIVTPTRAGAFQDFLERAFNQAMNLAGLQYVYLPVSSRTIMGTVRDFKPDVISVHNLHGGYFQTSLLTELSAFAPLVWTLHDMWAFTASAAHTFGDESWKHMKSGRKERRSFPAIGLNTGRWLLKRKKGIYAQSRLTVVAPSQWLYGLATQAPVFEGTRIVHVPNGIDLNTFRPTRARTRQSFDIPQDALVVMFAAEHLGKTEYKGGEALRAVLRMLSLRLTKPVHALMVGSGSVRGLRENNLTLHHPGYVRSEKQLAACYAAADVFLYPTRADNLPTALIEASASGTPSVAFDVGGCQEIVRNGTSGFVVPPGDVDGFVTAVMTLLGNQALRKRCAAAARRVAEQRFSLKDMARDYYHLFEQATKPSGRSKRRQTFTR